MPSTPARKPERGEIWVADLNPRQGTEPGKRRPVLIVQAQPLNEAGHPTTIVIPLTTRLAEDAEPLRIRVPVHGKLRKRSDLLVDQVRAIDNRRLIVGPLARLQPGAMAGVERALAEVLGFGGEGSRVNVGT